MAKSPTIAAGLFLYKDFVEENFWKKCSSCKKPINYGALYWACNVSTCNRKRTALIFCNVSCWDAHLGLVRHRESWAEERTAPTKEFWAKVERGETEWSPAPKVEKEPEPERKVGAGGPKIILRKK